MMQGGYAGLSQLLCAWQPEKSGEGSGCGTQTVCRMAKCMKTRITADLAGCTHYGHGAELLQNIGVAQNLRFNRCGVISRLVGPDRLHDRWNFIWGKVEPLQKEWGLLHGISSVVPTHKLLQIVGAMSGEDPQIM